MPRLEDVPAAAVKSGKHTHEKNAVVYYVSHAVLLLTELLQHHIIYDSYSKRFTADYVQHRC